MTSLHLSLFDIDRLAGRTSGRILFFSKSPPVEVAIDGSPPRDPPPATLFDLNRFHDKIDFLFFKR